MHDLVLSKVCVRLTTWIAGHALSESCVRFEILTFIYFTSIAQKARRTYRSVLEGAYVNVCGGGSGKNRSARGKPPTIDGQPLSCQIPAPLN